LEVNRLLPPGEVPPLTVPLGGEDPPFMAAPGEVPPFIVPPFIVPPFEVRGVVGPCASVVLPWVAGILLGEVAVPLIGDAMPLSEARLLYDLSGLLKVGAVAVELPNISLERLGDCFFTSSLSSSGGESSTKDTILGLTGV